jgi:hypothetical protein
LAEVKTEKLITPSWYLVLIHNQLDGRKPSSWLAELTGLHQSRFRKGASQNFHLSTLESIKQHQIDDIKKSAPDFSIDHLPSQLSGLSCPFQDLACIHQVPLLQTLSKEIDEFDRLLIQISINPSLQALKNIASETSLLDNPIYWRDDSSDDLMAKLDKCTTEKEAISISNKISINIFLSFLAAYDLEFCSIAFGAQLKLRPIFLDLVPKAHFKISGNLSILTLPDHKRFSLPTRRLLELTYAIFYYAKEQRWPIKPASRKCLETFSDDKIGSYFDGTKKLSLKNYERFTRELRTSLGNTSGAIFQPLLFATLFWENHFIIKDIKYKLHSVFLYDGAQYRALWEFHHQRWANQLCSGKDDWPTWLNN